MTGEAADEENALQSLRRIERCWQENVEAGQHALVIVDEAHLLTSPDQLETLRLLLNLRCGASESEAAWSLLLVGDGTLLGLIERNHALDQRLSVKHILSRFNLDQTIDYIGHRLQAVEGDVSHIFTGPALEALHMRASGIPRRINRLGDLALMVGYAEDLNIIDAPQIEAVHQELVSIAA
jgi:general secretion pathway protein A